MTDTINQLIADELARANAKFPQFHSTYEAYAVMLEEVEDAKRYMDILINAMKNLWCCVTSNDKLFQDSIEIVKVRATNCIKELIQVAAMCDKALLSLQYEETKND